MRSVLMLAVCAIGLSGGQVLADGFIIPVRPPAVDRVPPLSIKYHRVEVAITDQVARTRIDQVFLNEFHRDLEGTYIFPVPEEATISDFSMWVDGERISGRILDKGEAGAIYEEIVRREQDPALLEYIGRDLFQARVYPLPAHGEKRISLDYSEILRMDSGLCQYRYSLNTERFSARPLEEVSLSVQLESSLPLKTIYSPTHDIMVNRMDDHHAEVTYREKGTRPDRDFILFYTVSSDDFGLSLLTYREQGDDGFFLALIAPKIDLPEAEVLSKQILLVLDTSGSMSGEKIEQARDALLFCLNNLNGEDLFNIISFNTEIRPLAPRPIRATSDHVREARQFVEQLRADGGTNINEALLTSLRQLDTAEHLNVLVFLTDGLPTVGVTDHVQILDHVKKANDSDTRIFVFGVGYDVNTHLLDRIAEQNNAVSEYVRPDESIEVKVSHFLGKIASPVLTGLALDFGRIRAMEIYPRLLPDMFQGSQLVVLGRYDGNGRTSIDLTGRSGRRDRAFMFEARFPAESEGNNFIPRLWASRKIGYLIDEIRLRGENRELIDEVVGLSKEYGIMTEYTSFLVDTDVHTAMDELETKAREHFLQASRVEKGSWAVGQAQNARKMKEMAMAPTNEFYDASGQIQKVDKVRQVANKTFYFKNNQWVDNDCKADQKPIQVRRFSEAYFQLSQALPAVNQYLALGLDVMVTVGDHTFQIGDIGATHFSDGEMKQLF